MRHKFKPWIYVLAWREMKLSNDDLKNLLVKHNVATNEKIDEIAKLADQNNESILDVLYQKKILNNKDFTKLYSEEIGIPYIDLGELQVSKEILEKIPERVSKRYQAVVFGEEDSHLKVAMADPNDVEALQSIQKQCGYDCKVYIATSTDISNTLEQFKEGLSTEISKAIKETEEEISITKEELDENASADNVEAIISEAPIARAVNILIEYAIKSRASDIHIEPRENFVQVRYRVDGVLKDTMTLPKQLAASIVSRIKILSNLRIDEHRIPQDGRIKLKLSNQNTSIRVSTLPVMDGEKIVMRLLDETSRAQTLEELGYKGQALTAIEKALKKPHGMLLVTGPTGSGKSTTLYSVLSAQNIMGVNISTVEDPVEYRVQGVNQTQVNTKVGMTFASGLRALLRQDPDIIMVGEIRDGETAEMAVHAALTGHVVLSTLHTNNAAGCLPRLLDMEVEPFLIASTVNAVIGQRLVRKLCSHCLEPYQPDEKVLLDIINNFALRKEFILKNSVNKKGDKTLQRDSIFLTETEKGKNNTNKDKGIKGKLSLTLYRSKGCNKCDNSGYLGRMGIYEVLEVDEEIGKLIVGHATSEVIQRMAIDKGMITMQQDGFLKALEGITSVEEVLRVTRE